MAADDIGEGELVARIPRSALLTCANCTAVRSRLLRDDVTAARRDDMSSWVPLLLAMLAEYGQEVTKRYELPAQGCIVHAYIYIRTHANTLLCACTHSHTIRLLQKSASSWHPYLQLVPNYGSAHPPMLWSPSQLDTLLGGNVTCHM